MRKSSCSQMLGCHSNRSNAGSSLRDLDLDFSRLLGAIKACSLLRDSLIGAKLHSDVLQTGADSNIYVANSLMVMYLKCGRISVANRVFAGMPVQSLVSWTALMLGYVENGRAELALELLHELQTRGLSPNARCFVAALKACSSLRSSGKLLRSQALEQARGIHSEAAKKRCDSDVYVACTLIDLYANCGAMRDARDVFDKMPDRSTVAWNALILGYAENDQPGAALELFRRMKAERFEPDARTFVASFKACIGLAEEELGDRVEGRVLKVESLEKGRALHREAVDAGWESDIFVPSMLVEMYSKCGSLEDAHRVFERMPHHDVVPWNSMILGLAEAGEGQASWELFTRMKDEGWKPNYLTLVAALKGCSTLAANEDGLRESPVIKVATLEKVMIVHRVAETSGCSSEAFLANSLVDLYAKCGSMLDARRVFDSMKAHNVVCWTSLLLGYLETGDPMLAWEFFKNLLRESRELDARAMVAALKASTLLAEKEDVGQTGEKLVKLESLERTMVAHAEAVKRSFECDLFVASSLIAAYTKCGSLLDARRVFDSMREWDSVSWTALILGYAEHETSGELALDLAKEARPPSASILIAALKACTGAGALELLKAIHAELFRAGHEADPLIASSLLESFGQCGSALQAQQVFDWLPCRTLSCWNSLLMSSSRQGDAVRVLKMLLEIGEEGIALDSTSFIWILSACSHAGLVESGKRVFEAMSSRYGVAPRIEHYVSMADMLGRANQLEAAVLMVKSMPFEPDAATWITILGACHKWKNPEVGKVAFDSFLKLEKSHAAPFTLMANIYGGEHQH